MKYFIGTSGWHYDHWRGRLYPSALPKGKWLSYYARHFLTVELNNTFYRLPSEKAFLAWKDSSPTDFVFAIKVSRFITHIKRLRRAGEAVQNFLNRAKLLGNKAGPLLYQLPSNLHRNDEVLEAFLSSLPKGSQHVFEFRHPSWLVEGVFQLLRSYGAGFCVFDMPGQSCPLVTTADFAYFRFHGSTGLYWSCYSDDELAQWAARIRGLEGMAERVYIYFNNDAQAFAVSNAQSLARKLGNA